MRTTMMRNSILGALLLLSISGEAQSQVHPRLKDVRTIYVAHMSHVGREHGRIAVMEPMSNNDVRDSLVAHISTSGRFAAVTDERKADAMVDGSAGYKKSERNGKAFTSGFAQLQLVDTKSKEVLWTFEYKRTPGAGGKAADRVASQFVEKLIKDAKAADR